jgi:multidrug efflux system membrane fusion protein
VRLARRDVAEARFEQAEADLRDTELRAPFTGLIGRRYVENFEDVRERQIVVSLHAVDQVEVVVNVPESIMASVRADGTPDIAVVFEPAPERPYEAFIKEFAARADPQTQTFAVTVTLPQPEDINILPGMTATVGVTADVSAESLGEEPVTIPAHAVFSDPEGGANVWVVDGSDLTVHRRSVRAGPVTGKDGIIILEGLAPGERIATAGVQFLREGQEVRLMGSQR